MRAVGRRLLSVVAVLAVMASVACSSGPGVDNVVAETATLRLGVQGMT